MLYTPKEFDIRTHCNALTMTLLLVTLTSFFCLASPCRGLSPVYNVNIRNEPFLAQGDGITDDTGAIQRAFDSVSRTGGTVYLPNGVYRTTTTLKLVGHNINVFGEGGALIRFEPAPPFRTARNDRALLIGHHDEGLSASAEILGPIPQGSVEFQASAVSDVARLVRGDWLIIQEADQAVGGEIVWIDWVQVSSISNATVRLQSPMRMSFPNNHKPHTLTFKRVIDLAQNLSIRDLNIEVPKSSEPVVGIAIAVVRSVLLDHVTSNVANGNAFFSYRSADLTLQACSQIRTWTQATEFAATVDLTLIGNSFGTIGTPISAEPSNTSAFSLDYGTAFFQVVGNKVTHGGNIIFQVLYGVHDGVIANNVFGWSKNVDIGRGQGVGAIGVQHVIFANNILVGGDGPNNTGLSFASATQLSAPISNEGNVISANIIHGYDIPYGVRERGDSYFQDSPSHP